jgi:hypothetical protein
MPFILDSQPEMGWKLWQRHLFSGNRGIFKRLIRLIITPQYRTVTYVLFAQYAPVKMERPANPPPRV